MSSVEIEPTEIDYFTDAGVAANSALYFDYMLANHPVWRESRYGVLLKVPRAQPSVPRVHRAEDRLMADELRIDRDRCMGSGQCNFYAPATFDLDDLGIAVVIDQHADSDDQIQMAINVCPTRSIARIAAVSSKGVK